MSILVPHASDAVRGRRKAGRRARFNNLMGYLFISPWLFGFFVFTLVPIVVSFALAFTSYDIFSPPRWVGVENFLQMFGDKRYWNATQATLFYVFCSVPLRLIFALGVALLMNHSFRLIGLYRAVYYVPSLVGGSVAVAVMWRLIFGGDGLVNTVLAPLGIDGPNWLGSPRTVLVPLILLAVWQFGSPMLIFLAGLKQIPAEFYEAASIDGASTLRRFMHITLPMLSPVIFFNLVMQIISGFMVFTQGIIIAPNGGPLQRALFYSVYLYEKAFSQREMGYASAMAWVLLLIVAFFTAMIFTSSNSWVYYDDSKEES